MKHENENTLDDLDALLSRSSEDDAAREAEEQIHPFDREPDHPPPPDAASVRHVALHERDAFWSVISDNPWSFDFFGAVRRLEALYPELPGFGTSSRANEDTVRFSQHPSLSFAPCTISEVSAATERAPTRLFVNFMGMFGPNGPLPLHLTEYAHLRELHHKDRTFSRFLDVFNHRMVSLFYRSWAACNMPASFDRTPPAALAGDIDYHDRERILASEKDRYPVYIGALFGMGMDALRHRDAVPDVAKLHFSGRLAGQQTGPEGLRAILSAYFKVPVSVEEFAGRWMALPKQYWSQLGGGPNVSFDPDAKVGATIGTKAGGAMVCGTHVWDCQGAFRVRMGPMALKDFVKFVPGSASEKRLRVWIRNYAGDEFAWDVVIILEARDVPKAQLLAKRQEGVVGTRLGWTSWLRSTPETKDRPDMRVRSEMLR